MPIPPQANINDYKKIILKRKNWIIFSVIIAVICAFYFLRKIVPVYVARAKIVIEPTFVETETLLGRQPFIKGDIGFSSFLQAQYEMLRSRIVAERAVEILDWTEEKDVFINRILHSIEISPVKESKEISGLSTVIAISATERNPRIAMDIANAVAEAFVEIKKEECRAQMKDVYANLVEQVRKAREKLDESEEALRKYKEQLGIYKELPKELNIETIDNIKEELLRLKKEKAEKESLLRALRDISRDDIVQALTFVSEKLGSVYTVNVGLKQKLLDKENELNALSQIYKEKHPEMIRVKSEIELVRRQIRDELEAASNSLKSDIQTLTDLEEVLSSYSKRPDLGERQRDLARLEKEVNLNRDIYNNVLRKLKEVSLVEEARATFSVKLIEPASLPTQSTSPTRLPLVLFPLLGLFIGLLLALMREAMDTTIRTIEDVERYLNLSVLGVIPHVKIKKRKPVTKVKGAKQEDANRK